MKPVKKPDAVQGEGDYKSAERYDESVRAFVKSGKVPDAAKKAAPMTPKEAEELESAEIIGLSHSKGEDASAKRKVKAKP
jgi:hypothetical protein